LYFVVRCPRCNARRIVKMQRTFKCFGCGATVSLKQDYIIASAATHEEARKLLAETKARGCRERCVDSKP